MLNVPVTGSLTAELESACSNRRFFLCVCVSVPVPVGGGDHGSIQHRHPRDHGERGVVQTSGAVHFAQGQICLPEQSITDLFKGLFHTSNVDKSFCVCVCVCGSLPQGFEGTLVWENLDSGGLSTINSSSVELSDGGGVLKISSVRPRHRPNTVVKFRNLKLRFSLACRSQRGHCLTAAPWASQAWPEASRSPSTVGPAAP